MDTENKRHSILAEYYTCHYEELLGFVMSRLHNADEAEDVVQDVFLRLLQMNVMITKVSMPCLVYTTARNLILDRWRHCRCVEQHERYIKVRAGLKGLATDGESVYSAMEMMTVLEQGIAHLTDKCATVYRLNLFDGMKPQQISQILSLNYKTVEKRLGMARKSVRSYVSRCCEC